jgi:tripartite-type tricarboxylate transporter receptor subunit TctC
MTKKSMPVRRAALLLCAAACLPLAAQAQGKADWPTRPIRLIVGYASGSSPDVQARLLAEPLTKALGQPVVVENKVGPAAISALTPWPRPATATP